MPSTPKLPKFPRVRAEISLEKSSLQHQNTAEKEYFGGGEKILVVKVKN